MQVQRYKIKCLRCQGASIVEIDDLDRVFWTDVDKVISARKRLDTLWGFQCACGANDLITKQEARQIKNLQSPALADIQEVMQNVKPDLPQFAMEAV